MNESRPGVSAAITCAGAMLLSLFSVVPAHAGGSAAQTVPVKMGYFNLAEVKAAFPPSVAAVSLEEHAKDLLKHDVDEANKTLVEMKKQNKTKDEQDEQVKKLQLQISAEQQAMSSLLTRNAMEANAAISQAALAVAKEKGLDIVIDAAGIYAGGDKFASSGQNVTDDVIRKLVPKGRAQPAAQEPAQAPAHTQPKPAASQ